MVFLSYVFKLRRQAPKPSSSRIPLPLLSEIFHNPSLFSFMVLNDVQHQWKSPAKEKLEHIISSFYRAKVLWQKQGDCAYEITNWAYASCFRASNIIKWNQTMSSQPFMTCHNKNEVSNIRTWCLMRQFSFLHKSVKVPIHDMRLK
jgi:hypothetical protein